VTPVEFQRIEPTPAQWAEMDAFPDRVIFQTQAWLRFVERTQNADPVVAAVFDRDEPVGYFTGAVFKRWGVRVLGSPFPGWTTATMGFNLRAGTDRRAVSEALAGWAFARLGCMHLELKDRQIVAPEALAGLGFSHTPTVTLEADLRPSEEEVWASLHSSRRRAVRKAEKSGVQVQEASGVEFAAEYYAQLEEVYGRQSLRPTYDVMRVEELIRCVHPSGRLLLLRAVDADNRPLATALFPAMNGTAYFWGGASRREGQILRPNEAIFWYAMRYWKQRGMQWLDFGGGGDYKRKYGPREVWIPFFRKSRLPGLELLREGARLAAERRQRLRSTH
jgi:CelD/BcsL family acetyltransferase involved in cellulose biosynthesis